MEVQLHVSGGDVVAEIADLEEWFREERGLTGAVRPIWSSIDEGQLGGAIDLLAVAIGSGGAATVLAQSLFAWLGTRRPSVEVTVKVKSRTASVKASGLDADALARLLRQLLDDTDG